MLSVQFRYQLDEPTWSEVEIAAADYLSCDADDPNDEIGPSSTTRHDHPWQLVPAHERARLRRIRTAVHDSRTGESFECAYTFWRGVDNHVCLVSHTQDGVKTRELILVGEMPLRPNGRQVVRVELGADDAVLTMNWIGWGRGGDEHGHDLKRGEAEV
ncbi:MAG: hypothetical protein DWQ36_16760 [Acidobacteria bacterium]|nr:MAG: hypothetical protein DWQ30_14930 [Acidobacteriota bacterium]REK04504.1 MAG: hypothetical protein DWQ36_16760 [Acidobacteriota bacterium]